MKKLYYLLILGLFICQYTVAQNPPVAVNDTFYVNFSDTALTRTFSRTPIIANDYDVDGNIKIIDTISYNGVNQVALVYYTGSGTWLRLKDIKLTTQPGYFGLDSITYYLTDNGVPTGFDTAVIYIYVKRKSFENLDVNNVSASVSKDVLFMDRENNLAAFNVPKQQNINDPYYSTIYAANFWFVGIDNNSQLRGYAESFGNNGMTGGNAGPLMDSMYYEKYSYLWDRVWKVSALDIQNHISGNGTSEAIANWPAHADTTKGQAYYLAPFVDVDLDGIYSPSLGDYPKIKGQQTIYFIRNGERSANQPSLNGEGLEFHGMIYAFDCPEDSAINHTVFVDYKVINRSTSDLEDCYFGQWVDLDIGNSTDDFIACDVARGTFYAYNGDMLDEDANGVSGYGNHIPTQGVTFLKGAKQANDGNDNPLTTDIPTAINQNGIPYEGLGIGFGDGIADNEHVGLSHFIYYNIGAVINGNGDPRNGADFYNYLQGNWLDGVGQLEWGGDGNPLNTGGGTPSKYMFPRDSDPLFWSTYGVPVTPIPWTEVEAGNNPGDRRGIGSTGPFTLLAGESAEFELAFVFGRDYVNAGNTPGITVMQERVDSIRSYHANGFATTACGGAILGIKDELKENHGLAVYPNPFNHQFRVSYLPTNKSKVEIYNLLGSKVFSQELTKQETVFDLTNKPNGIYFIRVTDGDKVLTKKIVKQ